MRTLFPTDYFQQPVSNSLGDEQFTRRRLSCRKRKHTVDLTRLQYQPSALCVLQVHLPRAQWNRCKTTKRRVSPMNAT